MSNLKYIFFLAYILLILLGCTPLPERQAIVIQTSNRLPVEIGASPEAILGKCVKSVDKNGFAQYAECVGDFRSYYNETNYAADADHHERGVFRLDSRVGIKDVTIGGNITYYTEFKVDKQISKVPRTKHEDTDIALLIESCRSSPGNQYIIERVYSGCSATENIENLKQLDAKFLKDFITAGGFRSSVKTIGKPKGFTGEGTTNNEATCGLSSVISVEITPTLDICKNIEAYRITKLSEQNATLRSSNESLKIKIEQLNRDILASQTEATKLNETINLLNTQIATKSESSNSLLMQISQLNSEKEALKIQLGSAKNDAIRASLETANQKGEFESKLIKSTGENERLEKQLAKTDNELKDASRKLEEVRLELERNKKQRIEAESELNKLRNAGLNTETLEHRI